MRHNLLHGGPYVLYRGSPQGPALSAQKSVPLSSSKPDDDWSWKFKCESPQFGTPKSDCSNKFQQARSISSKSLSQWWLLNLWSEGSSRTQFVMYRLRHPLANLLLQCTVAGTSEEFELIQHRHHQQNVSHARGRWTIRGIVSSDQQDEDLKHEALPQIPTESCAHALWSSVEHPHITPNSVAMRQGSKSPRHTVHTCLRLGLHSMGYDSNPDASHT